MGLLPALLILVFACLVIACASNGFEYGADYIGRNLNAGVKGATINAIGSSLPEFLTTLIFLVVLKDADGFAGGLATTAGSALFNALVIPAVTIIALRFGRKKLQIKVTRKVILRDGIILLACEMVLIYLLAGYQLNWWHGLILMSLYIVYLFILRLANKRAVVAKVETIADEDNSTEKYSVTNPARWVQNWNVPKGTKAWTALITSALIIGLACHWLVEACIWLSSDSYTFLGFDFEGLNIPIYFTSVILASAATSIPDTLLSIKDAQKGNYDDSISNALGSNIFDICFALGLPLFLYCSFVGPIEISEAVRTDASELRILLFILTAITFLLLAFKKPYRLADGILLLSIYGLFIAYIAGKALEAEWVKNITLGLKLLSEFLGIQ